LRKTHQQSLRKQRNLAKIFKTTSKKQMKQKKLTRW